VTRWIKVEGPVEIGQVIASILLGEKVDLIVTRNIEKKFYHID
jgi:CxxC motif-containing protein